MAGGENDKAITAAHILVDLDEDLAVGKPIGAALGDGQLEVVADPFTKGATATACEDPEHVRIVHWAAPCFET